MQLKKLYKITLYMIGSLVLLASSYVFGAGRNNEEVKVADKNLSDILLPEANADIGGGGYYYFGGDGCGDCGDGGDGDCGG
jgi:hypothetical protein